jgi:hypothetical protein
LCSPVTDSITDFGIPTPASTTDNTTNNLSTTPTDEETENWLRAVLEPSAIVSETQLNTPVESSSLGAQSPASTTSNETTPASLIIPLPGSEGGQEQMEMDQLLSSLLPTSETASLEFGAGENQWPWTWGSDPLAVPSTTGSSVGVF